MIVLFNKIAPIFWFLNLSPSVCHSFSSRAFPNEKITIRDGGSTGLYVVNTVDTVDMVDTVGTVDVVYTVSLTKMAFSSPSVQALPVPKTKSTQSFVKNLRC